MRGVRRFIRHYMKGSSFLLKLQNCHYLQSSFYGVFSQSSDATHRSSYADTSPWSPFPLPHISLRQYLQLPLLLFCSFHYVALDLDPASGFLKFLQDKQLTLLLKQEYASYGPDNKCAVNWNVGFIEASSIHGLITDPRVRKQVPGNCVAFHGGHMLLLDIDHEIKQNVFELWISKMFLAFRVLE